jgi:hypothetical protein
MKLKYTLNLKIATSPDDRYDIHLKFTHINYVKRELSLHDPVTAACTVHALPQNQNYDNLRLLE